MPTYIKGSGNISPQATGGDKFLQPPLSHTGNRLTCIEPDYNPWIAPAQQRRMSRVIKMGVTAALMALKKAGTPVPDGIVTGTGLGCLQDTGQFLAQMIGQKEQALNPTPFIQSTHNTIGSQIALLLQAQGYNQTYAHDGSSFESALLDAHLQLGDHPAQSLLVGGIDEITDYSYHIQSRFGVLRKHSQDNLSQFQSAGEGTILGEGSAWFVVTGTPVPNATRIDAITTLYKPAVSELEKTIDQFLDQTGLKRNDIDLLISGNSGDYRFDDGPNRVGGLLDASSVAHYKHLCGEYPVSSAFALWLGDEIARSKHIDKIILARDRKRTPNHILIYNQYFGIHHSLILLKAC